MRDVRVTFPPQKVSLKKKQTEKWQRDSLDAVIGRENGGYWGRLTRKEKMGMNYELYNSNFNESDLKFLTDPYKVDDSFPIALQEINIIRPKIDLLVGEESKRPLNYVVIETNDELDAEQYDETGRQEDESNASAPDFSDSGDNETYGESAEGTNRTEKLNWYV